MLHSVIKGHMLVKRLYKDDIERDSSKDHIHMVSMFVDHIAKRPTLWLIVEGWCDRWRTIQELLLLHKIPLSIANSRALGARDELKVGNSVSADINGGSTLGSKVAVTVGVVVIK
ncbi:L-tyrosine decarboxylase, partial [Striga asiatica]